MPSLNGLSNGNQGGMQYRAGTLLALLGLPSKVSILAGALLTPLPTRFLNSTKMQPNPQP